MKEIVRLCLVIYLCLNFFPFKSAKNTHLGLISSDNDIAQISFTQNSTDKQSGFQMKNFNNGTMVVSDLSDQSIFEINDYKNVDFIPPLTIDTTSLDLAMKFSESKLIYEGIDQWTMIRLEDFQGSAEGWSKQKMSTCGTNDNMFLGGHCNFGGEEVSKNFTDIPQHSMLRITANFHFFDSWDGEQAFMYFNGAPVWSDSYKWCDKVFIWYCKKYAINVCGADYPDRMSVPIDFSTDHSSDVFSITFGAFHNKSACDASWGIDDVTVYIK
jgi:hypothetical protein